MYYFYSVLLCVYALSDSVAAVFGPLTPKNRKFLVFLNLYWMKTVTPKLCMLWPAIRGSSSRWGTVFTYLQMLLISGELSD